MSHSVSEKYEFQYYENSKVKKLRKKIKERKVIIQGKGKYCRDKVCFDGVDIDLSISTIKAQKILKTQGAAAAAATGLNECAECKKRSAFKGVTLFTPHFYALNGICGGCQQAYKVRMVKKEAASAAASAAAASAVAAADIAEHKVSSKKWSSSSVGCSSSEGYKGAAASTAGNSCPAVDEGLVGTVTGGQYRRRVGLQFYGDVKC